MLKTEDNIDVARGDSIIQYLGLLAKHRQRVLRWYVDISWNLQTGQSGWRYIPLPEHVFVNGIAPDYHAAPEASPIVSQCTWISGSGSKTASKLFFN